MTIDSMMSFGYGILAIAAIVIFSSLLGWIKRTLLRFCRRQGGKAKK